MGLHFGDCRGADAGIGGNNELHGALWGLTFLTSYMVWVGFRYSMLKIKLGKMTCVIMYL